MLGPIIMMVVCGLAFYGLLSVIYDFLDIVRYINIGRKKDSFFNVNHKNNDMNKESSDKSPPYRGRIITKNRPSSKPPKPDPSPE